ncbi:TetR/AcrR family transcriptional regulator [Gordonia jinhuaensis]|uniref:TetR/AcrR family transcriptional regulator n=1 Tax=Gordonia jinhuaensis TaxID=1517702 RepID=UPI0016659708|nr:TetR family transcriptional regulator C-terminal domain-containing protein [Gordonia jinhuaensis]
MAARTRTRKPPAERADEIRAAAREIACAEGLTSLTLRAIGARVGVAPALVAHYEPVMDELIAATFAAITTAEVDDVADLVGGEQTATDKLRRLIATLTEPGRDDVTVVWADAFSMGRTNESLAAAVREVMDRWQQLVGDLITGGVDSGEFRTDDADDVAWQFLGMIDGVNSHAMVRYADTLDRGRLVRRAMENELTLSRGALHQD